MAYLSTEHSSHADIPLGSICNVGDCGSLKTALDELILSVILYGSNHLVEEAYKIKEKYSL